MFKNEEKFPSAIFEFAKFYVNDCKAFPHHMDVAVERMLELLSKVSNFGAVLSAESGSIASICGNTMTGISGIGNSLEQLSCNLANQLIDIREYFSCSNFRPVYEKVMYEATCQSSNAGFAAIAFAQLLIVFFSMIMLTLRVAFADIEEEEDEETRRKCLKWCRTTLMCNRDTKEDGNDADLQDQNENEDLKPNPGTQYAGNQNEGQTPIPQNDYWET
jgi:hypothetical protein